MGNKRKQGKEQGPRRIDGGFFVRRGDPQERSRKQAGFNDALAKVQAELRQKPIRDQLYSPPREITSPSNQPHQSTDNPRNLPPSETFETSYGIATSVDYISNFKGPGVLIKVKNYHEIYSCLIIIQNERPSFGIGRAMENGRRPRPQIYSDFQNFYEDKIINSSSTAKIELDALKETINTKKDTIEKHLKLTVNLDNL